MKTPKLELEIQKILRISNCSDCQAIANYLKAKNPCRTRIKAHKIYQIIVRKMKKYEKQFHCTGLIKTGSDQMTIRHAYDFLKNGG